MILIIVLSIIASITDQRYYDNNKPNGPNLLAFKLLIDEYILENLQTV